MTLFRGTVLDTPEDPFAGGELRAEMDAGVLVRDGAVVDRGPFSAVVARHPDDEVVDLSGGLLLPGFVDTHVHLPQVRVIGRLGMPLLSWLDQCALPEEARLADEAYARSVARDFVSGLAQAGTTTALVFGSHFAPAVDALFAEASRVGLRVTSGLVVSDRLLRKDLLTTPERAYDEGLALAGSWHGVGRNRYAVIPRFSLSCDGPLLESCASLLSAVDGALLTSHINENPVEIALVSEHFGGCDYLETYERHGLVRPERCSRTTCTRPMAS
jgi:guanine deaminase